MSPFNIHWKIIPQNGSSVLNRPDSILGGINNMSEQITFRSLMSEMLMY